MPEQNKKIVSKYQGEANPDKRYLKLGRKITDVVAHKIKGVTSDDPEYWGLREVLTPEMCDVANVMKLRKFYTLEEMIAKCPDIEPTHLKDLLEQMSYIGILEYDYGDNYDHTHELKDKPRIKRYRVPFYVPGSAELFNSSEDRIAKNPAVASFFERMTFIPLAGITQMVPPGGDGIGMHVIPIEEEVNATQESVDLEHISYWLQKYDGHIAAGICSCRASRKVLGDGCADDVNDWCIQLGDMADYCVETNRAHYITKEKALEILKLAEDNGFVHQITNIDGSEKIFDICNCDVKICNALRTSLLFNTPYLSRSSFTSHVDEEKCAACGKCAEVCPTGAVKLTRKLCKKDGSPEEIKNSPIPDNNIWGKYMWDEDYRDTARKSNTYESGSSPCKAACPANVPVQAYLRLAKDGKYLEALKLIKTENPLPAVCGRICNKRCEAECTRGLIDDPVSIDAIKKFVADLEISGDNRYIPDVVTPAVDRPYKEKIAIIGSGPAGLSAAYYLACLGYKPTIFEKCEKPGGMLRYGIPSYKLQKNVIDAEIDVIIKLGTDIKCGIEIGKDKTLNQLRDEGYKAFYIAIGCQEGGLPGLDKEDAKGCFSAVNFLHQVSNDTNYALPGKTVVIGGGNVAIDAARTAHKCKSSEVIMYCLESADEMPATPAEIEEAKEDGVVINCGWGPSSIQTDDNNNVISITLKRCTSVFDEAHKFAPKYDESDTITVECNNLIFSIGQKIDWGEMLEGEKVEFWHGNYPVADKFTYQTAQDDIFVGGDVYTGPKFAIDAIAAGHAAAESLHRFVRDGAHMTIGRDRRNYTPLNKNDITFPSYDTAGRQEAGLNEHATAFADPHLNLSEEQVHTEASRCLSCGVSHVDENKCIGCGLCTTRCEFDAIHLVRNHPECTDMRKGEDKIAGLALYAVKRAGRIIAHSGSEEAKELRRKRKEFKRK